MPGTGRCHRRSLEGTRGTPGTLPTRSRGRHVAAGSSTASTQCYELPGRCPRKCRDRGLAAAQLATRRANAKCILTRIRRSPGVAGVTRRRALRFGRRRALVARLEPTGADRPFCGVKGLGLGWHGVKSLLTVVTPLSPKENRKCVPIPPSLSVQDGAGLPGDAAVVSARRARSGAGSGTERTSAVRHEERMRRVNADAP